MKNYMFRLQSILLILAFLTLFVSCSFNSKDETEAPITTPTVSNSSDSDSFNNDESVIATNTPGEESENIDIQPTPSFPHDSPLEIEVDIKQPWDVENEDNIEDDGNEGINNPQTNDPNFEIQDSHDSNQGNTLEGKTETEPENDHVVSDENQEVDDESENIPSGEIQPEFSLEIE